MAGAISRFWYFILLVYAEDTNSVYGHSPLPTPSELFTLSNDSLAYDVFWNEEKGAMYGREFVTGPTNWPYPAFRLTGTSFLNLVIDDISDTAFAFVSFISFDSADRGVIYEYSDNLDRLAFRLFLDTGMMSLEVFNQDGTFRGKRSAIGIPVNSWWQLSVSFDNGNRRIQINQNDNMIMITPINFVSKSGINTPGVLRVGKSFSGADPNLNGKITCLRVYNEWVDINRHNEMAEHCNYRVTFPWLPFSGPYGCMYSKCQNKATCSDNKDADYTCTCALGYTGKDCEIDIDDCGNHRCQNGGTCTDGVNVYSCTCLAGFTGPICQHSLARDYSTKYFQLQADNAGPLDPLGMGSIFVPSVQRCGLECVLRDGCLSFTLSVSSIYKEIKCTFYSKVFTHMAPAINSKYYIPV